MSCSFRHLLDRLIGKAGPGLGGLDGTGRDAEGLCGVEIVNVKGGGPLRLRDRFSRERDRLAGKQEG